MSRSRKMKRQLKRQQQNSASDSVPSGNMLERMQTIAASSNSSNEPNDDYSSFGYRKLANGIEYNPSYDTRLNKGGHMDGYSNGNGKGNVNPNQYQFKAKKDEHVFTCASGEIEGKCPLVKDKPTVYVNAKLWDQWISLCDEVKTEWIAYFRASQDESKEWTIEEFYFPAQTATGT